MKTVVEKRWDKEYSGDRYINDPPIPFVDEIIGTLKAHQMSNERGIYIGCGNGRNYIPLIDSGLNLIGLDIASGALQQIRNLRPSLNKEDLIHNDFLSYEPNKQFDYVIAIQIFQHGDDKLVAEYFHKTNEILKPGGLFFLRVNSVNTEIYHRHTEVGKNKYGGFTIRYIDGPKKDLPVHFYSKDELLHLTAGRFEIINPPKEVFIDRPPPKLGKWAQWEATWQKQD